MGGLIQVKHQPALILPARPPAAASRYAQFGGRPIGWASSTNFAAERITGSENLGPTICRPEVLRARDPFGGEIRRGGPPDRPAAELRVAGRGRRGPRGQY